MKTLLLIQTEKNETVARVIENCNSLREAKKRVLNTRNEYNEVFKNKKDALEKASEFTDNVKHIKL